MCGTAAAASRGGSKDCGIVVAVAVAGAAAGAAQDDGAAARAMLLGVRSRFGGLWLTACLTCQSHRHQQTQAPAGDLLIHLRGWWGENLFGGCAGDENERRIGSNDARDDFWRAGVLRDE